MSSVKHYIRVLFSLFFSVDLGCACLFWAFYYRATQSKHTCTYIEKRLNFLFDRREEEELGVSIVLSLFLLLLFLFISLFFCCVVVCYDFFFSYPVDCLLCLICTLNIA